MYADPNFPLIFETIQTVTTLHLLASIKHWLETENPICLLHPNGFYVTPLSRSKTEEWRFHFWPPGLPLVTGMPASIHNHNWHITSRILQGQLTNVMYDMDLVSQGGHPLYEVHYSGDRYSPDTSNSLNRTRTRVQPKPICENTMQCGDVYQVPNHFYHKAVVSNQSATATICRLHQYMPGKIMVVGLDGYSETISFKRTESRASAFVKLISP